MKAGTRWICRKQTRAGIAAPFISYIAAIAERRVSLASGIRIAVRYTVGAIDPLRFSLKHGCLTMQKDHSACNRHPSSPYKL